MQHVVTVLPVERQERVQMRGRRSGEREVVALEEDDAARDWQVITCQLLRCGVQQAEATCVRSVVECGAGVLQHDEQRP